MILTIFTPTYNREGLLHRTYESLLNQSCKEFIWLIIDDGSSDNTKDLVKTWQLMDNGFKIEYIYKENGGMHSAHNKAYDSIYTELNVCIDSDDALAIDAVAIILSTWNNIKTENYAGIIGLDADFNNQVIGTRFREDHNKISLNEFYSTGGRGDKKLVLRTEVVNEFPRYPIVENEKFVPLGTLYSMIGEKYKFFALNKILCNVEYLADGSTKNMIKQYYLNPQGFRYARLMHMKQKNSLGRKFKLCIHYVSSSILANKSIISDSPFKILTILAYPFGVLLTVYIIRKNKKLDN